MARPKKKGCDWFPHDSNLRNEDLLKILMNKYPNLLGYGFYVITMEFLTTKENGVILYDNLQKETLSAIMGITVTSVEELMSVCVNIGLFTLDQDDFLRCPYLESRLERFYEKRSRAKEAYDEKNIVSAAETPQKKTSKSTDISHNSKSTNLPVSAAETIKNNELLPVSAAETIKNNELLPVSAAETPQKVHQNDDFCGRNPAESTHSIEYNINNNINSKTAYDLFTRARKMYPGDKDDARQCFELFKKRAGGAWMTTLLILEKKINEHIAHRAAAAAAGAFVPEWKSFRTWISKCEWNKEFADLPKQPMKSAVQQVLIPDERGPKRTIVS